MTETASIRPKGVSASPSVISAPADQLRAIPGHHVAQGRGGERQRPPVGAVDTMRSPTRPYRAWSFSRRLSSAPVEPKTSPQASLAVPLTRKASGISLTWKSLRPTRCSSRMIFVQSDAAGGHTSMSALVWMVRASARPAPSIVAFTPSSLPRHFDSVAPVPTNRAQWPNLPQCMRSKWNRAACRLAVLMTSASARGRRSTTPALTDNRRPWPERQRRAPGFVWASVASSMASASGFPSGAIESPSIVGCRSATAPSLQLAGARRPRRRRWTWLGPARS
jgi:hypothetical protein